MPATEAFETPVKMPATSQGAAYKVDLRTSTYAGRYALDGVLVVNGSAARLQVRAQNGVAGEINGGQPLQVISKPTGLTFAVVPLDAAVAADEVMLYLKWRPLRQGETLF